MKEHSVARTLIVMFFSGILLFAGACGEKKAELSAEDEEGFRKAIVEYCEKQNMGMAISSFEKSDVKEDKAKVTCKMKAADGPAISVKFTFEMSKKDGKWVVNQHSR